MDNVSCFPPFPRSNYQHMDSRRTAGALRGREMDRNTQTLPRALVGVQNLGSCARTLAIRVAPPIFADCIGHIVPHTHRLRRLEIMGRKVSVNTVVAPFRDAVAPALEYLRIQVPYEDDLPLDILPQGLLRCSPFSNLMDSSPSFRCPSG
ncbi:hypothetical protein FB451DRAFT_408736 [Mycena latifolia]|nr:hypothetical protein FB451DRAFT_408736 [Mycena latifolia]